MPSIYKYDIFFLYMVFNFFFSSNIEDFMNEKGEQVKRLDVDDIQIVPKTWFWITVSFMFVYFTEYFKLTFSTTSLTVRVYLTKIFYLE